jgi:DNA-binding protein HU-beta
VHLAALDWRRFAGILPATILRNGLRVIETLKSQPVVPMFSTPQPGDAFTTSASTSVSLSMKRKTWSLFWVLFKVRLITGHQVGTGGESLSNSLQYVQARLQRRVGMIWAKIGWSADAMARANILASRQRRLNFRKAFMPGRGQSPRISLYAKSLTARRILDADRAATMLLTVAGSISWIEMTKPQLVESVATATGQTKSEVERILDAILDRASNALAGGDRVELRGFGILEAKETKARTGRNPGTGETIQIAASRRATFRPSKELKERLNGKREEAHEIDT